ncbi:MAG: phosphate ABC transporter permease subunit PstC [Oscillospiraceae bacterium]|jgi:phosphate transport system permease protein|nr:phosphate ABC transporter permease subunit PstC [Oscillospiraceae bacterium]
MKDFKEKLSGRIFFVLALSSISVLALITVFILIKGTPLIAEVGLKDFIFGMTWAPGRGEFGIFPMIAGSVSVTFGAAVIGVPIGICCSIFLAEFAPAWLSKIFRPVIQLLAGIPSVVYGFWGMIFVVPLIRDYLGGPGLSILAGSIILAIMILPTVISISEVSILALPRQYKEGALALGMTHWQAIYSVVLPSAKSGIVASVVLGIGRAVGETMAVIMVLGNAVALPESILDPVRTLTTNIGIEMGYAEGAHEQALFATGIVLFVVIMIINGLAQYITRDKNKGRR